MDPVLTQTFERALDFISPRIGDMLLIERRPLDKVVADTTKDYGIAHPKPSQYPNHKLAAIKPDSAAGMMRYYWLAERADQQLYNYELTRGLSTLWPRLTQTWVILREDFTGLTQAVTAPPALGQTWTRIGANERRTGDEITDGLFVILEVVYEDIALPVISQEIDRASGGIATVTLRKVPTGTAAQPANAQGYITEIEGQNTDWALSRTSRINGLAGTGKQYDMHRPYPWPVVLVGFQIVTRVTGALGYDYATKRWDDECLIHVRRYWSPTAPAVSQPSTMGATAIVWKGGLVNVNIPPCLHPFIKITETANGLTQFRNYAQTAAVDWPPTRTVIADVQPFPKGGFEVEEWTIERPAGVIVS